VKYAFIQRRRSRWPVSVMCEVMGWSLGERMTLQLVMDVLRMAWFRHCPGMCSGLIFHSDLDSQYCGNDFQDLLKEYGIRGSISRKADCWDNDCSETLFRSLKVEWPYGMRFDTRRAAKDEVIDRLLWHNSRRLHLTLGYTSPIQYEQHWLATQPKTVNI